MFTAINSTLLSEVQWTSVYWSFAIVLHGLLNFTTENERKLTEIYWLVGLLVAIAARIVHFGVKAWKLVHALITPKQNKCRPMTTCLSHRGYHGNRFKMKTYDMHKYYIPLYFLLLLLWWAPNYFHWKEHDILG